MTWWSVRFGIRATLRVRKRTAFLQRKRTERAGASVLVDFNSFLVCVAKRHSLALSKHVGATRTRLAFQNSSMPSRPVHHESLSFIFTALTVVRALSK